MAKEKSLIQDMTQGSVTKLLLVFSFPLMLSNLLQTLYNMVDMIVIGQFVGKVGLSAVSIGGELLHLLTFLVMGLSSAGQVILSQYIGAGDRGKVKSAVGTMFTLIFFCAVLMGVVFLIFLDPILGLINTPEEAFAETRIYSLVCICGIIFIYGYNLVSAILRGMGDSRHPFIFIAVASVVNLVLDLLFVAGLGMGAAGAALATVIGQAVSFVWAMIYLIIHREAFGFDFKPRSFIPDRLVLGKLLALGLPMALQSAALSISMLFVNALINTYGVVATAVTGIGNKLTSVIYVITGALSTASATMIGQNLGAEKYDRVPKVLGVSLVIDMTCAIILSLAVVIFPRQLFGIFNSDADVLEMAMTYIPVAVLLFVGAGIRSPFFGLINGSGNAKLNLAVALLDGVICRIGLAVLMGLVMGMGIMGFWLGNAFAGYVPFFIGLVYMLSGSWKRRKVVQSS